MLPLSEFKSVLNGSLHCPISSTVVDFSTMYTVVQVHWIGFSDTSIMIFLLMSFSSIGKDLIEFPRKIRLVKLIRLFNALDGIVSMNLFSEIFKYCRLVNRLSSVSSDVPFTWFISDSERCVVFSGTRDMTVSGTFWQMTVVSVVV